MDETIRELERLANNGDADAKAKLTAAQNRSGLSSVDTEYLQKLLLLTEESFKEGPSHPDELLYDEEEDEYIYPHIAAFVELTNWARQSGVSSNLIRTQLPGEDALTNSGAWYNSSMSC